MSFNYLSKSKQNNWSKAERIKLNNLAGTMTIEDLTKEFPNRSMNAVKIQCHKQGVKYGFLRISK